MGNISKEFEDEVWDSIMNIDEKMGDRFAESRKKFKAGKRVTADELRNAVEYECGKVDRRLSAALNYLVSFDKHNQYFVMNNATDTKLRPVYEAAEKYFFNFKN